MTSESDILKQIQTLSTGDVRLWRNNIGQGYQGQIVKKTLHTITLAQYRHIHFGIPGVGGSDLLGLKSVVITPDMIGQRLAIFAAIEGKSASGRAGPRQLTFLNQLSNLGCLTGIARSIEDAQQILKL